MTRRTCLYLANKYMDIGNVPQQPLTFGQKAVGLTFNPGGMPEVQTIKTEFAQVIDTLNTYRTNAESGEVKRLLSVAITEAQSAQMFAVKAVTWKD